MEMGDLINYAWLVMSTSGGVLSLKVSSIDAVIGFPGRSLGRSGNRTNIARN